MVQRGYFFRGSPHGLALQRLFVLLCLVAAGQRSVAQATTPTTTPLNTPWQAVGPMQVSTAAYGKVTGRVSSIAIDAADTSGNTVYLGTTGGGVWKSTNALASAAAVQFTPLTDNLQVFSANAGSSATASLSIGSVSVQPGGTGVVLAGTGDPNNAADSYYGSGLLRSADNGTTWSLVAQSNDGAAGNHSFAGESFAGFAWSAVTSDLVVAAVSSSARGSIVGASTPGASVRGLYYSTDAGATWQMSTIQDGTQVVQSANSTFTGYEGNAATSVVWNPVRKRFYAAVRFHGYYESTDGRTFTRLAAQPGSGLTTIACPVRANAAGLTTCPIFRGAIAAQPTSGDLFALTVDAANGDTGLYQDVCSSTGSACTNTSVLWIKKLTSTPLENTSGAIPQGASTLALAAMPATGSTDTLLFVGTAEIFRCRTNDGSGCTLRNTTNVATASCTTTAMVAPSQHAIAFQSGVAAASTAPLFFGNDGGLWRSTDGVNQQSTACSADDATHFDNLNTGLGSLAEVNGLSTHPTDSGTALVALGLLGSAAATTSSSNGSFQSVWTQTGTGYGAGVAIDQATPANWLLQSGSGVSLAFCAKGTACAASDFAGTPAIGAAQVNSDPALPNAPFLLDPALNSNAVVATCRVYRGPANGVGWSAANAISAPLTGSTTSSCSSTSGLVRSIAAGGAAVLTNATQTSGSPVLYAGMAGTLSGGGSYGGRFFRTTSANLANSATQWTDVTDGTVTNDRANNSRFNPLGYDVSSIAVDPNDASGMTVYATIGGFGSPLVYRSTNGAASWTNISANLPQVPANAVVVDPNNSHVLYVAQDSGVYVTADVTQCTTANAQCWGLYGTALPNAPETTLVASTSFAAQGSNGNGVLRAGTYGRGIWQIPLLTAGQSSSAAATLSPASLNFGTQAVGYSSASQTVTVTNTGNAALTISRVAVSASWTETDNCTTTTIAVNGTCAVQVSFTPSSAAPLTGTLSIFGNVTGGYASAALSGTGAAQSGVLVAPASIAFADTAVRSSSAAATVTLTNSSSQAATLQAPVFTGDFQLGTTACTASLAGNASCSFTVIFAPAASGLRTGLLTFSDNFGAHTVPLSGNGIAGEATVTPLSIQFADTALGQVSATRAVTVTNTGNGPLAIGAVTLTGDFSEVSDTCGNTTLASAASCVVTLRFAPAKAGTRLGTLLIASNSKGDTSSTVSVALGGNTPSAFSMVLTPVALDFGQVAVSSTSAVRNVTISNTGTGSGAVGAATVSGDYVVRANTCGSTLPSQTGCTISLAFAPTASGTRTGTFSIGGDAGAQTASLTGVGTLPATDVLSPLSLSFAATVNTASATQTVQLTNTGDVALTLVAAKIVRGDFTVVNGCGTSLAAHAACGIVVTFTPKSTGTLTGTLEIDDVLRAQTISLSGTATAGPGVSLAPVLLSFPATGVGNATIPQSTVLTNNGGTPLQITAVTITAEFSLLTGPGNCATGTALSVGASCSMQVLFAPQAAGARSGTLTVSTGSLSQTVLLGGTGVDFALASNGSASATVATGSSAVFPLLLTPAIAAPMPVTFTCTGAPSNAKCTVVSAYADLSATNTVTVTVLTGTTLVKTEPLASPFAKRWVLALAMLLPIGVVVRRRRMPRLAALLVVGSTLFWSGCGSSRHIPESGLGSGSISTAAATPAGSYNIVVTASAAGLTKQVPLTLIVTAQ